MSHIRNILVLSSTLFLASCWMGCKFSEEVACPKSNGTSGYTISLAQPYCEIQGNETLPASSGYLKIPQEYRPTCSTEYPVPEGTPITRISMTVSYPDFKPAKKNYDGSLKDGQIAIYIGTLCSADNTYSADEKSKEFLTHVKNNEGYMDDNGKHQFAPIKALDHGWHFQQNIREPYLNGNAHIYFYQNDSGKIDFLLGCDDTKMCYSRNNISINERYEANYRFMNIPYTEFINLHAGLGRFLASMYKKDAEINFSSSNSPQEGN